MVVRMRLELEPSEETLCGKVTLDGEPPRGFTGWIGLNAVVDALLATAAQKEGAAAEPRLDAT